jgi:MFS family permease
MPSEQSIKRALRGYVVFQLLFNLLLWIPVFYEVQKQLGLTDPEIFRIQSIYYLVFCFLEIPTGFIADRYGYKTSMLAGALTLAVANVTPIVAGNFAGFLTHFCLIAFARSLISGAASAWLFEYMRAAGRQEAYKQVEGDARFYALVARVVSWAAVGWLMQLGLLLPYWISAGNALIAAVVVATLPAVRLPDAERTRSLVQNFRTMGEILRFAQDDGGGTHADGRRLLLLLMMQGVGIFVLVRVMQVNLYQPVLTAKSFDATSFGLIMSVMTIFEAIGSKQAWRLRARMTDLSVVMLSTLVLSGMLIAIALGNQWLVIAGFCVFSLAAGVAFPVQKQVLNEAISQPGKRATILSVESIVDRALCAVVVLPLGGLVAAGRLTDILIVCGAGTAVIAVVVQALIKRSTVSQTQTMQPVPVEGVQS